MRGRQGGRRSGPAFPRGGARDDRGESEARVPLKLPFEIVEDDALLAATVAAIPAEPSVVRDGSGPCS